jgi:hypothetical protein
LTNHAGEVRNDKVTTGWKQTAADGMHAGLRVAFRRGINPAVLRALHSPGGARRLGGSLVGLRYRGRVSGQQRVLVVGYVREGDRLVVYAGFGRQKVWWRNFRRPGPVEVLLDAQWQLAQARVLLAGEPGRASAVEVLQHARPRQRIGEHEPIVEIRLGAPDNDHMAVTAAEQVPAAKEMQRQ